MLNRMQVERGNTAKIRYLESDFQIISPGTHVMCAITGQTIPLDELKYWSFERQEAYVDAASSLKAEQNSGNLS